jgi:hypothetical protein
VKHNLLKIISSNFLFSFLFFFSFPDLFICYLQSLSLSLVLSSQLGGSGYGARGGTASSSGAGLATTASSSVPATTHRSSLLFASSSAPANSSSCVRLHCHRRAATRSPHHCPLVLVTLPYDTTLPPLRAKTTAVVSSRTRFICSLSRRGVATGTCHMCLVYASTAIFSIHLRQMWHCGCYGV